MSSHREAPEISKDPAADNTDVYAFVSAGDTVTLIANFIPFQIPYGGPNFAEFADSVVYGININNVDGANADIRYEFRFTTSIVNTKTFLYNVGPIGKKSTGYANWNRPQTYSVTKLVRQSDGSYQSTVLATGLSVPPCNVGIRSTAITSSDGKGTVTSNYDSLYTQDAVQSLGAGRKVFAGQRSDPFYVDLGSVFDLGALRLFNQAHLIKEPTANGVNGLQGLNVHTIALQVPISDLTSNGVKNAASAREAVIGVWANTTRSRGRTLNTKTGKFDNYGDQVQVSRLGHPLFNEVINPMAQKDYWNTTPPRLDSQYAANVTKPELQGLLPVLYPNVFPKLAAYTKPRNDLAAILLTGLPTGVIPNFQNYTGTGTSVTQADFLRLNTGIAPATNPNRLGLIAGDAAGYPNGRRLTDDTTTIQLRAIAGVTIPLVDPSFTPDGAAGKIPASYDDGGIYDGTSNTNLPLSSTFPFVAPPAGGYQSKPGTPAA